ncbi:TPA_asm: hypothetical protein [Metorhabdovirus 1]|nr:TPA_asm: hypothetical protein [Metorhabdovirus 1]
MITVITFLALVVSTLGAETPFPIFLCGANQQPIPTPLQGITCESLPEPADRYLGQASINYFTGTSAKAPVEVYKCHRVITFAECFVWFLGVKDKTRWSKPGVAQLEQCTTLVLSHVKGSTSNTITYPDYYCYWLQTNTRHIDNDLFEPTTAYYDILTDTVKIPGSDRIWNISKELFFQEDAYYWIPDTTRKIIESYRRQHTKVATCEVYERRIRCPHEAVTIWMHELVDIELNTHHYMRAAEGFYIAKDHLYEDLLKMQNPKRVKRQTLHIQYLLDLIRSTELNVFKAIRQVQCEARQSRRIIALALASVSPALAAEIEFGQQLPGVSLTPAGLVKYSCQEIHSWRLRSTSEKVIQIPVTYTPFPGTSEIHGWLDPMTRTIASRTVPGTPARFVRVNSSAVYDIGRERWLEPADEATIMAIVDYPLFGIMSYLQDEIETMATLANSLSALRREIPAPREAPTIIDVLTFGERKDKLGDMIRKSHSWFSNILPNWLSGFFDIGGSVISTILTVWAIVKLAPFVINKCKSKRQRRKREGLMESELRKISEEQELVLRSRSKKPPASHITFNEV